MYFNLMRHSLKVKFRDYKTLIMMTLFPLALALIFVTVFSSLEDTIYNLDVEVASKLLQVSYELELIESVPSLSMAETIIITMIGFVGLLGGQYGVGQMQYIYKPEGKRVTMSPVSKIQLYISESMASLVIIFMQLFLLSIVFSQVFKVPIISNFYQLIPFLIVFSLMSMTLGICIGAWIRDEGVADSILSFIVTLMCFLSGGLVPNIPAASRGFHIYLTPITLVNQVLEDFILYGKSEILWNVIGIFLLITTLLGGLIWIGIKRREKNA